MVAHRDLPVFKTPAELFAKMPEIELLAICTPPGVRHAFVREAIDAGKHILMEKPPTPTISELDDLVAYAKKKSPHRLLHMPLEPEIGNLAEAHRRFVAGRSMRDVEPNVTLKVRDPNGNTIANADDLT